jgi:hypothetical protein
MPSPTINFWVDDPVLPEDLSRTTTTLRWNSQNATSCSASGAIDWSGSVTLAGNKSITVPTPSTYRLDCQGPGGTIGTLVSVGIGNTNGAGPQVSLRADAYTIPYGTAPVLVIQSQDVGTCFSDWLGGQPLTITNGQLPASIITPITAPTTYQVTCQDSGGLSLTATATLTISTAQFFICPEDTPLVVGWAPVQYSVWYVENAPDTPNCGNITDAAFITTTVASGGSISDVSANIKTSWTSSNGTGAISVSATGLVTALDDGSASLNVSFEGPGGTLTANSIVDIVLPPIFCHRCDTAEYTCSIQAYFGLANCPAQEQASATACAAICRNMNMIEVAL